MGVFRIPYGNSTILSELPERTRVLTNTNKPLPAIPDPAQAVRDAINSPVGHDPLHKLVNSKSKVTIAFDDPIGSMASKERQPGFVEVAIKVLFEELEKLGVDRHNIRLVCAVGLHRKWTPSELATVVGQDVVRRASPSSLFNFDAEDKENLVFLGETKRHQEVEISRLVTESDQLIYVSHPWSHFNGAWKTITVGLSSWRSIRHHHRPVAQSSGKSSLDPKRSAFPKLLNEMGAIVEAELAKKGRRVLIIEGTNNNSIPQELVHVVAGHPIEAHAQGINIIQQQQVVDVKGQSDVVIYGIGNNRDPYSLMIRDLYSKEHLINPLQVRNLALSYSYGLFQNVPLVKPGGILIFCHPCVNQFNPVHNPSYIELFEKLLPHTKDPVELWELYAEEFANRPEYVHKYRYGFAFHGAHPLILYGQGLYGLNHAGKAFLAGATDFEVARRLSLDPFASVEAAVAEAENLMGKDCSITYLDMPESFVCNVEP